MESFKWLIFIAIAAASAVGVLYFTNPPAEKNTPKTQATAGSTDSVAGNTLILTESATHGNAAQTENNNPETAQ